MGHKGKISRIGVTAVAVLASAGMLAACGGGDSSSAGAGSGQTSPVNLRLDFVHTGKDALWTYGVDKGIFKDAGINLTINDGKGSATTAQTVSNGSDDIGMVDGGTWLTAASTGLSGKAVMSVFQGSPLAVLSPEKSPINAPKDLEGKKVGITAGDGPSTLLPALLDKNGVEASKVNKVNLQAGPKLTALATGGVEAVATTNLVQATLEATGTKSHVMMYSDYGIKTPGWYLVSSQKMLDGQSDVLKRFVGAVTKSIDATVADPKAAVDSFVKKYPEYDRNRASNELNLVLPLIKTPEGKAHATGWMSTADAQSSLALLTQYGGLKDAKPVDHYLTDQYLPAK